MIPKNNLSAQPIKYFPVSGYFISFHMRIKYSACKFLTVLVYFAECCVVLCLQSTLSLSVETTRKSRRIIQLVLVNVNSILTRGVHSLNLLLFKFNRDNIVDHIE